ncbi:MAG TPA: DNA-packaging protein [Erysipelotrichaceae bacterium]|jgi:hypothetical protein|nr:DNA-packaging protein [Erysipelotrichaceae bacterium]
MLEKVRLALRITTTAFDSELSDLINAAYADLGIAGVVNTESTDPIIIRAVTTYCRMNFGEVSDYDRLKASYDEQKAQLSMASGYTDYSMLEA